MTKLRVYEYAKTLNMSSKEIVSILKRLNVPVNNHMSVIDEDAQIKITNYFEDIKRKANENKMKKTAEKELRPEIKDEPKNQGTQVQAVTQQPKAEEDRKEQEERKGKEERFSRNERGGRDDRGGRHDRGDRGPRNDRNHRPYRSEGKPNQPESGAKGARAEGDSRGSRPDGGPRGNRPERSDRPDRNERPGDRGERQDGQKRGGRYEGNRGPRPEGGRDFRSDRTGKSDGFQQRPQGGRSGDRRGGLVVPPPAQVEEKQETPRRRNQPKKVKEKEAAFEENKKGTKRVLKNNVPKIDYDSERGEVVRGKKRNKNKKNRDVEYGDNKDTPTKISIAGSISVGELAKMIGKDPAEIIKKLLFLGIMATINQEIDFDVVTLIAGEYGIAVEEKVVINEDEFETIQEQDDPAELVERPPVVTIMGHVDHGKTTLLDSIRNTKVTATEAGGITQHIGAYQVEINNKLITFLDTPGHEAFTAMRARGAKVTDITVLVVAADDGVMPQTIEAINHAKAADVPIIVAVNKMDKPTANPDRVKQELSEHGLLPEEWGGDTIYVPVSALKGEGIDELLEMILLVAEVQELKANPNKRARGTVVEAKLDKGKGPVATVLVQNGTLKVGDPIVVGTAYGRVRSMVNDMGRRVKEAPPSMPVEITGLDSVPQAGDQFMVFEEDSKAKAIAERRAMKKREQDLKKNNVSLDDLFNRIKEGEIKDLNIIIKADVQGSVEALKSSIEKIQVEGVRVKIIHSGVGAISEYDIMLASASNAIVIGFNVRPDANARVTAERENVDVRLHRIIYKVIEEIEAALKGMLDPVYAEKVIGQATIRQTFKVSKVGTIAGCYVTEGKVTRDSQVRVIRDGIVIFEGEIDTLKRFKDDVREVAQGYECGLTIKNYNDLKEGDTLEFFVMETVKN
jgi:translation initiation factor IF-2